MNDKFYVGSYKDDAINGPNRGWIMGTFMANPPRKNPDVEVMYWEFLKGKPTGHPTKISSIIECTLILKGSSKAIIDNQEIILKAGDYIVIAPGTSNNTVVEILEDCAGITIKAPSDPTAKQIIDK